MNEDLKQYGSLLRPDLYGEFKECDWRGSYKSRAEYLQAVIDWERANGVEPNTPRPDSVCKICLSRDICVHDLLFREIALGLPVE